MKNKQLAVYCTQQLIFVSLVQITLLKSSLAQQSIPEKHAVISTPQQYTLSTNIAHFEQELQLKQAIKNPNQDQTQIEFEHWQRQQPPQNVAAYQRYMQEHLKHVPSLLALTQYAAALPQQCEQLRFDLPEKQQWRSIGQSLQLLEKLHEQGMFKDYQVVGVRGFDAERCVAPLLRRHDYSMHRVAAGVYFKISPQSTDAEFPSTVLKQLCRFWKLEGKHYQMGIALYPDQILHISRGHYQSWGKSPYSTVECHAVMRTEKTASLFKKSA